MQLKRVSLSLAILVAIGAVLVWKGWQKYGEASSPSVVRTSGPAVILFRGDRDPSCQAVYDLVSQAAARHGKQIHFVQVEWSSDNPLIKKYEVRFLPTVVFIDQHNQEVDRVVGESPATRQKLVQQLARVDDLLHQ